MLTPGVHNVKAGDERYLGDGWHAATADDIGGPVWMAFRRPIPPHILDSQAFWIWRGDKQEYPTAAELAEVGGIDSWRAQIIAGRLYDKWLLEQMEDV